MAEEDFHDNESALIDKKDGDNKEDEIGFSQLKEEKSGINMEGDEIGLKRQIGLLGLIAYLVGSIIGSGIFATPKIVATYSGSSGVMMIIWIAGGVIAIVGGLIWCELALTFPKLSGGEYSYVYEAFGSFPAFIVTYTLILTKSTSTSMMALVAGNYIVLAVTGSENIVYSKVISAVIIAINLFINCYSVTLGKRTQIFFTVAKLLAIVILVMTGFIRLGQGYTENLQDPFNNQSADSVSDVALALYGSLYSFGGWYSLGYVTAEMINPVRDYPLAIFIGLPLVIGCYLLVNVAYLTVKSPLEIAASSAIAVIIGKDLYGVMHWIIPVLVACSCFGASNCGNFFTGRTIYESAHRAHLPKFFGSVHTKRHTPIPGLILSALISWIVLLPDSSDFKTLLGYVQFIGWTNLSIAVFGLIWMRKSRPNLKRPFKLFIGIPILFWITSLFIIIAPFIQYPTKQALGLIFLLPSIPLYFAFVKYQIISEKALDKLDAFLKRVMNLANLGYPDFEKAKSTEVMD